MYFYLLSEIRYGLSHTGFFSQSPTSVIPSVLPPGATISTSIQEASRHVPSPSPSSSPEIADAAGSNTINARSSSSTLPKLSSQGNIVAGAVARTSVGFVLNPITVVKSRYEVSCPGPARFRYVVLFEPYRLTPRSRTVWTISYGLDSTGI